MSPTPENYYNNWISDQELKRIVELEKSFMLCVDGYLELDEYQNVKSNMDPSGEYLRAYCLAADYLQVRSLDFQEPQTQLLLGLGLCLDALLINKVESLTYNKYANLIANSDEKTKFIFLDLCVNFQEKQDLYDKIQNENGQFVDFSLSAAMLLPPNTVGGVALKLGLLGGKKINEIINFKKENTSNIISDELFKIVFKDLNVLEGEQLLEIFTNYSLNMSIEAKTALEAELFKKCLPTTDGLDASNSQPASDQARKEEPAKQDDQDTNRTSTQMLGMSNWTAITEFARHLFSSIKGNKNIDIEWNHLREKATKTLNIELDAQDFRYLKSYNQINYLTSHITAKVMENKMVNIKDLENKIYQHKEKIKSLKKDDLLIDKHTQTNRNNLQQLIKEIEKLQKNYNNEKKDIMIGESFLRAMAAELNSVAPIISSVLCELSIDTVNRLHQNKFIKKQHRIEDEIEHRRNIYSNLSKAKEFIHFQINFHTAAIDDIESTIAKYSKTLEEQVSQLRRSAEVNKENKRDCNRAIRKLTRERNKLIKQLESKRKELGEAKAKNREAIKAAIEEIKANIELLDQSIATQQVSKTAYKDTSKQANDLADRFSPLIEIDNFYIKESQAILGVNTAPLNIATDTLNLISEKINQFQHDIKSKNQHLIFYLNLQRSFMHKLTLIPEAFSNSAKAMKIIQSCHLISDIACYAYETYEIVQTMRYSIKSLSSVKLNTEINFMNKVWETMTRADFQQILAGIVNIVGIVSMVIVGIKNIVSPKPTLLQLFNESIEKTRMQICNMLSQIDTDMKTHFQSLENRMDCLKSMASQLKQTMDTNFNYLEYLLHAASDNKSKERMYKLGNDVKAAGAHILSLAERRDELNGYQTGDLLSPLTTTPFLIASNPLLLIGYIAARLQNSENRPCSVYNLYQLFKEQIKSGDEKYEKKIKEEIDILHKILHKMQEISTITQIINKYKNICERLNAVEILLLPKDKSSTKTLSVSHGLQDNGFNKIKEECLPYKLASIVEKLFGNVIVNKPFASLVVKRGERIEGMNIVLAQPEFDQAVEAVRNNTLEFFLREKFERAKKLQPNERLLAMQIRSKSAHKHEFEHVYILDNYIHWVPSDEFNPFDRNYLALLGLVQRPVGLGLYAQRFDNSLLEIGNLSEKYKLLVEDEIKKPSTQVELVWSKNSLFNVPLRLSKNFFESIERKTEMVNLRQLLKITKAGEIEYVFEIGSCQNNDIYLHALQIKAVLTLNDNKQFIIYQHTLLFFSLETLYVFYDSYEKTPVYNRYNYDRFIACLVGHGASTTMMPDMYSTIISHGLIIPHFCEFHGLYQLLDKFPQATFVFEQGEYDKNNFEEYCHVMSQNNLNINNLPNLAYAPGLRIMPEESCFTKEYYHVLGLIKLEHTVRLRDKFKENEQLDLINNLYREYQILLGITILQSEKDETVMIPCLSNIGIPSPHEVLVNIMLSNKLFFRILNAHSSEDLAKSVIKLIQLHLPDNQLSKLLKLMKNNIHFPKESEKINRLQADIESFGDYFINLFNKRWATQEENVSRPMQVPHVKHFSSDKSVALKFINTDKDNQHSYLSNYLLPRKRTVWTQINGEVKHAKFERIVNSNERIISPHQLMKNSKAEIFPEQVFLDTARDPSYQSCAYKLIDIYVENVRNKVDQKWVLVKLRLLLMYSNQHSFNANNIFTYALNQLPERALPILKILIYFRLQNIGYHGPAIFDYLINSYPKQQSNFTNYLKLLLTHGIKLTRIEDSETAIVKIDNLITSLKKKNAKVNTGSLEYAKKYLSENEDLLFHGSPQELVNYRIKTAILEKIKPLKCYIPNNLIFVGSFFEALHHFTPTVSVKSYKDLVTCMINQHKDYYQKQIFRPVKEYINKYIDSNFNTCIINVRVILDALARIFSWKVVLINMDPNFAPIALCPTNAKDTMVVVVVESAQGYSVFAHYSTSYCYSEQLNSIINSSKLLPEIATIENSKTLNSILKNYGLTMVGQPADKNRNNTLFYAVLRSLQGVNHFYYRKLMNMRPTNTATCCFFNANPATKEELAVQALHSSTVEYIKSNQNSLIRDAKDLEALSNLCQRPIVVLKAGMEDIVIKYAFLYQEKQINDDNPAIYLYYKSEGGYYQIEHNGNTKFYHFLSQEEDDMGILLRNNFSC